MSCSDTARRVLAATIVVASTCALAADAGAARRPRRPRPEHTIKFATLAPDGSTWMKTMHAIDDAVRERTANRLGFKFYPGGVQGDEKDVLRKIRNGQLHAGGFTGNGLGAIVPEVRIQELPFLFESLDQLDSLRSALDPYFARRFEEAGYVLLGWVDVGFIYIFSREPVRTPDDMRRARMWMWSGDPLAEMFFRAFAISPIPLAAPDVLTSLQTGVIDAVYCAPLACIALQWYTRVQYMTDVPVTHGIGAVLVSRRALARVRPEDVAALREIAAPRLRELTLRTRRQNREAIEELKKEGIRIVSVDDAVRREFYETGRRAWHDGVGRLYPAELLQRVRRIVGVSPGS